MARTAYTRSNRTKNGVEPSQRATQNTQNGRDDSESGEEDYEVGGTQVDVVDDRDELTRQSNALVRLALFNEHRRTTLKRDEITKKVFGGKRGNFNVVFQLAQRKLMNVFGMELTELMTRSGRDEQPTNGTKKKAPAAGSKTYILRSILHAELIEAATQMDKDILEDEIDDGGLEQEQDNLTLGSILDWKSSDQLPAIGILYVLLALILVTNGSLSDLDMRKYLKSLRLPPSSNIDLTAHSTHRAVTIEALLTSFMRQGYLDKVKSGTSGPAATQGKRGRTAVTDGDDLALFEWKWGPRSHSEVGEKAIAEFMAQFLLDRKMLTMDSDDDEGEPQTSRRKNGTGSQTRPNNQTLDKEKRFKEMMEGIARAAGGMLHDIRR